VIEELTRTMERHDAMDVDDDSVGEQDVYLDPAAREKELDEK
jgi:hypothetical protein